MNGLMVRSRAYLLWSLVCVWLTGCNYTVALVSEPVIEIDRAALGLWQRTRADGNTERLLVLPMTDREYLLSFPAASADAMFARATLWRDADMTLVQLDWFGTARGKPLEMERRYQYAAYAIDGDRLWIRLLNTKVVDEAIDSPVALVAAIRGNWAAPGLFREALLFHRVQA